MTAFDEGNYPDRSPARPTAKVAAVTVAGAVTILLLYIARLLGLDNIPPEVAGAVTLLLSVVAGYVKKDPNT